MMPPLSASCDGLGGELRDARFHRRLSVAPSEIAEPSFRGRPASAPRKLQCSPFKWLLGDAKRLPDMLHKADEARRRCGRRSPVPDGGIILLRSIIAVRFLPRCDDMMARGTCAKSSTATAALLDEVAQ
jgi:hypothetical protein